MTVNWNTERQIADVRKAVAQGVVIGAENVLSTAVSHILHDPKTGRIYKYRTVTHRASAPGEAPASDTGRLAQSGTTEHDIANLESTVSFRTKYAAPLEYGTPKIKPRPYARVSLEENRKSIIDNIKNLVAEALSRLRT